MKDELIDRLAILFGNDGNMPEIKNKLYMIFRDYKIEPAETALIVRDENKNEWALKRFLMSKKVEGRTKRTLGFYQIECTKMLQKIGKDFDRIEADDIRLYMALRLERDRISKVTLNNELRAFSAFFTWLLDNELVLKNPVRRAGGTVKTEKKQKKAFTDLEIEKLRDSCINSKEKCIIELLLSTGCRVSELAGIKLSNIEGNKILVMGKGEKERYVYLNAKALLALEKYKKDLAETDNPYLFPMQMGVNEIRKKLGKYYKRGELAYSVKESILPDGHGDPGIFEAITRNIGKRCGVLPANPHRFRRTCATMALRKGMSLIDVSRMLGHEQIDTTKIYLDLNEKDLEIAHEKYVV